MYIDMRNNEPLNNERNMPCSKKIMTSNLGERGKDGISWDAFKRNKAK